MIKIKVKICGLTNLADAKCALDYGADLIGFVFYKASPRSTTPERVREIIRSLPPDTQTVGVFVNETTANMRAIKELCGLKFLQLHGDETMAQLEEFQPVQILKALSVAKESDLEKLSQYSKYRILVDSPSANHGGSGKPGNWELAARAAKLSDIYLAGGLNPENITRAIHTVKPYGVDVSSGVEKEAGLKDWSKVQEFIKKVRMVS